jgi:hypothetical protein
MPSPSTPSCLDRFSHRARWDRRDRNSKARRCVKRRLDSSKHAKSEWRCSFSPYRRRAPSPIKYWPSTQASPSPKPGCRRQLSGHVSRHCRLDWAYPRICGLRAHTRGAVMRRRWTIRAAVLTPRSAWADRVGRVMAISISVTVATLGVARIPSSGERTGGYRRWTLLHHRWSPVACYRPIDSRGSPDRARPNTDGVAARGSPHQGNTAGVGSPSGCAGRKSGFGGARLAAVVGADRRATPDSVAGPGVRAELADSTHAGRTLPLVSDLFTCV